MTPIPRWHRINVLPPAQTDNLAMHRCSKAVETPVVLPISVKPSAHSVHQPSHHTPLWKRDASKEITQTTNLIESSIQRLEYPRVLRLARPTAFTADARFSGVCCLLMGSLKRENCGLASSRTSPPSIDRQHILIHDDMMQSVFLSCRMTATFIP
jgi:hypothetical protein